MTSVFHPGEIAVQKQAGTYSGAGRIGGGIRPAIPRMFREFMEEQAFAVAASMDEAGCVWASALTGEPGFIRALDDRTVHITAQPVPGDPLADNLKATGKLGLLVIEFTTRGRIRLNGNAELRPNGIRLRTEEVFGNCQKYIQGREWMITQGTPKPSVNAHHAKALGTGQKHWIEAADTFFVATANPAGGADASHRGGQPGFVRVVDDNTLVWPDYSGNGMFQTLGNLALNPRAGLLFVDFERGGISQLTGHADIIWDEARAADFTGAERLVEFHVERVIEMAEALPLRFSFMSYSPYNPR